MIKGNSDLRECVIAVGGVQVCPVVWLHDWPIIQSCLKMAGVSDESRYLEERVVLALERLSRMPSYSGRLAMTTLAISSVGIVRKP